MSSERVFQILLFLGFAAGGWLYGDYWKKADPGSGASDDAPKLRAQNAELLQDLDRLEDEVAQLRSLLANGPYPVPDDLIAWVEKEHNLTFLKIPEVRLGSPTDFREAAHNNLRLVHGEENLSQEGLAWELLGLLPPNQKLPAQLLFVQSTGIKGIFDMTSGVIFLSEEFDPVNVPDRSVLVRLLGRQLSYQHHPQTEWTSRDHWQAWEAIQVGAAADLQARFLKRNAVANEAGWSNPEPQREDLLNTLSPALQGFCNFPFLEGTDYARNRYLKSREAWSEMLRTPPTTTSLVLHPERETPIITESFWGEPSENTVFENSLGELGLRLWLEQFLGIDQADQLTPQWAGDHYQLIEEGRTQSLVWRIRLTSAEVAEQLQLLIERSVLPVLREDQPIRILSLTRDNRLLTFTNLPEKP